MDYNTLISTSALFHYTKKEYLETIIKNGFKPRIVEESFDIEKSENLEAWKKALGYAPSADTSFKLYVPMICFCDIPLTLVTKHSEIYGEYAIGMTKDWGKEQGVSSIIYVRHGSEFMSNFRTLYQTMNTDKLEQIRMSVYSILRLIKPYIGYFKKGTYENENHKFYDEREWRYVPPFLLCTPFFIEAEKAKIENFNNTAGIIGFDEKDIEVIIVKEESEIIYFYEMLKSKFPDFDKKKIVTINKTKKRCWLFRKLGLTINSFIKGIM